MARVPEFGTYGPCQGTVVLEALDLGPNPQTVLAGKLARIHSYWAHAVFSTVML